MMVMHLWPRLLLVVLIFTAAYGWCNTKPLKPLSSGGSHFHYRVAGPSLKLRRAPISGERRLRLQSSLHNDSLKGEMSAAYMVLLLLLPLSSNAFPLLLERVTDFSLPVVDRQVAIITLLLAKRIFLYINALVTLTIAAARAADEPVSLGERLQKLNAELLPGLVGNVDAESGSEGEQALSQQELYSAADRISNETQAILLPLLLTLFLIASYLALARDAYAPFAELNAVQTTLMAAVQLLSLLPAATVSILFTSAEFGLLLPQKFAPLLAIFITGVAFVTPSGADLWAVHNVVCACIAINTARAVQLSSLPAVLLALSGLVVYDVIAVIGTQKFTDGGMSVMEAIARAKVASSTEVDIAAAGSMEVSSGVGTVGNSLLKSGEGFIHQFQSLIESGRAAWAPGLFEVSVGGHLTDALGLADVVFPAMLVTWALRFDTSQDKMQRADQSSQLVPMERKSLYRASIIGFVAGCLACEVFQTGTGQPALLFLVPSMVAAVVLTAQRNDEIGAMWNYTAQ